MLTQHTGGIHQGRGECPLADAFGCFGDNGMRRGLRRLIKILKLLLVAAIGYTAATVNIADLAEDLVNMVRIAWAWYRLSTGWGGTISILISGFFLGQGIYLATRQIVRVLGHKMIEWAEQDALWDAALLLPSRFGIERYLDTCIRWVGKKDLENSPSLALFNISGLWQLNDQRGTKVVTELLLRIVDELQNVALPPTASPISHFFARYLPRPPKLDGFAAPPPRCPGRWSSGTVSLAFRNFEIHKSITLAREFADWLREEFAAAGTGVSLGVRVAIACGRPGVSAGAIGEAATMAIARTETSTITVALDPADQRASLLTEIPDVRVASIGMNCVERGDAPMDDSHPVWQDRLKRWTREWGLAVACIVAVPIILLTSTREGEFGRAYPWPPNLTELPVVEANEVSQIRIVRSKLTDESMGNWRLSNGQLAQAEPGNQRMRTTQIRVDVTNISNSTRYVSTCDFVMSDANGREMPYAPRTVLRYKEALHATWLQPGQTYSGWLIGARRDALITALVFRPDRETRIVSRVKVSTQEEAEVRSSMSATPKPKDTAKEATSAKTDIKSPIKTSPQSSPAVEQKVDSTSTTPVPANAVKDVQVTLVITPAAAVRSEPDIRSTIKYRVKEGEKAIKLGSSGKWVNVELSSGETGWIFKDLVKDAK
jgi:hypothetical protein